MDGFPKKYNILPRPVEAVIDGAQRVGKFLGSIVFNTNVQTPLYMSNHYNPEHFGGAAEMLDRMLAEEPKDGEAWQPELDFTTPEPQTFGWDDCGNYTSFTPGNASYIDRSRS